MIEPNPRGEKPAAQEKKVPYDRLIIRQEMLKGKLPNLRTLFKSFLVSKVSEEDKGVTKLSIERLDSAIASPVKKPVTVEGGLINQTALKESLPLEKFHYYHARLCRSDAEDILLSKPVGHFLVRVSKRTRRMFAIILSIRTNKGIAHYEVPMDSTGRFYFNEFAFPTVHELLFFHWKHRFPVSVLGDLELYLIKCVNRQDWEFDESDVALDKQELGEGNFGTVHRGSILLKGKKIELAVKTLQDVDDENGREELLREARIMRKMNSEGVLRCYGVTVSSDATMILLEFVNGGSMDKYLRNNKLKPYDKLKLITSVANGLAHVHKREILHRDVAARNCLVELKNDQPVVVKIGDFGLSIENCKVFRMANEEHIPVRWSAPEVLHERLWTQKSDVWSFGVTLWEFFFDANLPYFELDPLDGPTLLQYLKDGYRLMPVKDMPDEVIQLLNPVFSFNMDFRPSMEDVAASLQSILGKKSC